MKIDFKYCKELRCPNYKEDYHSDAHGLFSFTHINCRLITDISNFENYNGNDCIPKNCTNKLEYMLFKGD